MMQFIETLSFRSIKISPQNIEGAWKTFSEPNTTHYLSMNTEISGMSLRVKICTNKIFDALSE